MVKDKNIELAKVYNGCPRCWKLFLNVTKVRHLFRNCQIKQKGIEAAVKLLIVVQIIQQKNS